MTSLRDASSDPMDAAASSPRDPTWPRVGVVAALLVLAFFVAKSCQDSQIEVTEAEAVAAAEAQVDFVPEDTQVRLLRQGIDRRPFWIVSLSILSADGQTYDELALVRIDATSGEIVELRDQSVDDAKPAGAEDRQGGT